MTKLMQILKKNPVFRFLSSVRMAVPLMLVIAGVVAVGTLYEARYNAQVASIVVYRSVWFQVLMGLLWLNIFCATISRIPYKVHHTGFVVTHIGLLTLLIGAQLTASYGIDGHLRVVEGESGRTVFLPELAIKVAGARADTLGSYTFKRSLSPLDERQLGFAEFRRDTGLVIEKYLPFVTKQQGYVSRPSKGTKGTQEGGEAGTAIELGLRSPMFNVREWLHSKNRPEGQMGPLRLRMIAKAHLSGDVNRGVKPKKVEPAHSDALLIVKDEKTNAGIAKIAVMSLKKKPQTVRGVRITLLGVLEQGVVSGGKLVDGGQPGENPTLVLNVESEGKSVREVSFAKFPSFSLSNGKTFGLKFEYQAGAPGIGGASDSSGVDSGGNLIEILPLPSEPPKVKIALYKNGQSIISKVAGVGETVDTPWMGMKITVGAVLRDSIPNDQVASIDMEPKSSLPPSAIYVRPEGAGSADGVWLMEGEYQTFQSSQASRGSFEVYYGNDSVELPFTVGLKKFQKIDYPGTQTPMSFQSTISIDGSDHPIEVMMNEPFQQSGYILYQSSYEMGQGMPTASIFSVNKDPGRLIKYFGAVILILGIAIYTVMRSSWYLNKKRATA